VVDFQIVGNKVAMMDIEEEMIEDINAWIEIDGVMKIKIEVMAIGIEDTIIIEGKKGATIREEKIEDTMIEEAIMEMIGGIVDNNIKGDQSMEILLCQVKMIYTKKSVDEKETLSHLVREILYPDVHRARNIVLPIQMIVAEDPLRLLVKGP